MSKRVVADRCGKCWGFLSEEDNYCRQCGTKRGDGDFNPESNVPQVVYGPPPLDHKFECRSCGLTWTEYLMVNFNRFCPRCGKKSLDVNASGYNNDFSY